MIRIWCKCSFLLLIVFVLLIGVSLAIGSLAPAHPAVAGFEFCDGTPCWLHIDIQQDTPFQALDNLDAQGYVSVDNINYLAPHDSGLCDIVLGTGVIDDEMQISSIQLLNCQDLRLGDIWSVFGTPTMIANDCFNNWVLWYDNTVAVILSGALVPENTVNQIAFYNLGEFGIVPYGVPWHGFTTQWRYNQLEGNIRGC
jgi:hypothetical protein